MGKTKTGRKAAFLSGLALVLLAAVLAWVNRAWVIFFLEFESLGRNARGYPEYRHRKTRIVFVRLPGGEFYMGSSQKEVERAIEGFKGEWNTEWIRAEQPRHKVTLSPFLIAKYETSQAEWERAMENNPSEFKGIDLPVEQVSWEECKEFSIKTGFSLPTEAQWEYACRGGTNSSFAFGEMLRKNQANVEAQRTVEVDSFKPNGFGLYNMHGNVWEWCEDVYDPEFYEKPEAGGRNPVCTSGSGGRVLRGGCWGFNSGFCRSAFRLWYRPSSRNSDVGFRSCKALSQ